MLRIVNPIIQWALSRQASPYTLSLSLARAPPAINFTLCPDSAQTQLKLAVQKTGVTGAWATGGGGGAPRPAKHPRHRRTHKHCNVTVATQHLPDEVSTLYFKIYDQQRLPFLFAATYSESRVIFVRCRPIYGDLPYLICTFSLFHSRAQVAAAGGPDLMMPRNGRKENIKWRSHTRRRKKNVSATK